MIVTKQTTNPYIASRNYGESVEPQVVFEGNKKECEEYLLEVFNENEGTNYDSVGSAIRFSNHRGTYDGIFRTEKKRLYMNFDSRYWEIINKNEIG